jgi:hypothetical protein
VLTLDKGYVTPERLGEADNDMLLTFTGFDEKSNNATMVGNQGSAPVLFFDVMGHVQIIEITDTKNVATTTNTVDGQTVRAVQTRHMAVFDGGVVSVYSGPCSMR